MRIDKSESFVCRGEMELSGATLTLKDSQLSRNWLEQQDLVEVGIPLSSCKVWDDLSSNLPGTAAADDLAIVEGIFGTDAPTIQSDNQGSNGTPTAAYARFMVPIYNDYVLGESIQLSFRAGMVTAVSDTTATLDLVVYVNDGDGAVGTDICATSAQSINSLTKAEYDFTITPTSLAYGDILDCRVAITIEDATTGTVIGEISKISLLRDIRG